MAISVIIGVFVGLVVGCASMAMWAARRIGDEAARQFDRGFERGRWLADLTTTRGLGPAGRARRIPIDPGEPAGGATSEAPDPPPLLMARRYRSAEAGTDARPPLRPGPTWLDETATRLGRIVHDSGSMARVCRKETADAV